MNFLINEIVHRVRIFMTNISIVRILNRIWFGKGQGNCERKGFKKLYW